VGLALGQRVCVRVRVRVRVAVCYEQDELEVPAPTWWPAGLALALVTGHHGPNNV
jgi:hypothetical protein